MVFAIVFLQGSVYLFSARMALLCFVVAACFVLFKELKSNVLKIGIIAGVVALTAGIVAFSPIKERYRNVIEFKAELPNKDMQPHEVNYRYAIYHCTRQVLEKNWLFGVGVDKVQESLNVCYATFDYRGYDDFTKNAYNTHNQYADMWLKYGIFGLLGFVLFLTYFLIKGSFLHKIFILIFALALLTENMLNRQIGIVTFTLFNAIFVALNYPNFEKSISRRLVR